MSTQDSNIGIENKRTRKGNREGSLIEKRPGYWEMRIVIDGKRRTFTGKTKTEVRNKTKKAIADSTNGIFVEPNKLSVEDWLKSWLFNYARLGISQGTYADYEAVIRKHVNPVLGKVKLTNLTASQIQKMINDELTDKEIDGVIVKGLSPRSCTLILGLLKQALKQAALEGLVQRNVAEYVKAPRKVKKEARYLSKEEATAILEAASDDILLYHIVHLLLGTGLRIGEALALRWENVDLDDGNLVVKESVRRVKNFNNKGELQGSIVITKEPKSKAGRRNIPMSKWTLDSLKSWKKFQDETLLKIGIRNPEFVFTTEINSQVDYANIRKRFKRITDGLDLEDVGFHCLRHTFATRLLEANVNIKTAQELLGHSTIAMTMDIYSHVMPDVKKDAMKKLDEDAFVSSLSPVLK